MTEYITPKNWPAMFLGAKPETHFIKISAHSPPSVDYATLSTQGAINPKTNSPESYSFFYPKNTIREDISHNYGAIESSVHDILAKGKAFAGNFATSVEAIKTQLSDSGATGILIEQPAYFLNSNKRKFDMVIDLYDTGDIANDVYNPILFFKRYSHAQSIDRGKIQRIKFPHTFTLTGGVFNTLNISANRNHFILLSMSTVYNQDLQFVTENGLPVNAQLTLSFEEIHSLFSDDWTEASLKTALTTKRTGQS